MCPQPNALTPTLSRGERELVKALALRERVWVREESRWRSFTYDELIARDKTKLEIF